MKRVGGWSGIMNVMGNTPNTTDYLSLIHSVDSKDFSPIGMNFFLNVI
jgi:hypothetical protein